MACNAPLVGLRTDVINPDTGKHRFVILPRYEYARYKDDPRYVPIPCGQCMACRLQYSRQWANRCMLELQYHKFAYFVTLTYNDDHLPLVANPDSGELMSATLSKRDVQLFFKRLRKISGKSFRYFLAGEYGSTYFRPHYHMILFGLPLDDLVPWRVTDLGHSTYRSPLIERAWSVDGQPIGFVLVGGVTWESCAYVARYICKKQMGDGAEVYDRLGIIPEFTLMSRKPGIGRQYYDDHPDIYETNYITISTPNGGISFKAPRYYDKLYDLEYPDKLENLKVMRQSCAQILQDSKLSRTSLSIFELQDLEEKRLCERTKSLEREL